MVNISRRQVLLGSGLLAVGLAGCGQRDAPAASTTTIAAAAGFPRTIDTTSGQVRIDRAPNRVAVLSSEVGDIVLDLVGPERIGIIPQTNTKPAYCKDHAAAKRVGTALAFDALHDPEQVLAARPDVALVATRHDSERDVHDQLVSAGVPVVAITNDWDTPQVFAENVRLVGRVLGVDDAAERKARAYLAAYQKVVDQVAGADKPLLAMIKKIGAKPWLSGPHSIGERVGIDAGSQSVAARLGMSKGAYVDIEQLVKANPTALVLAGNTTEPLVEFDALLKNPALAGTAAIRNHKLLALQPLDVSSGTGALSGLQKVAAFLHPDLVK